MLRLQNIQLYGTFSQSLKQIQQNTEYCSSKARLIIMQGRLGSTPPQDILQDREYITSPYCKGFSKLGRLIYDKTYFINTMKSSLDIKVNLRKRLRNISRRVTIPASGSSPDVYEYDGKIYMFLYVSSNSDKFNKSFWLYSKCAYIDEN